MSYNYNTSNVYGTGQPAQGGPASNANYTSPYPNSSNTNTTTNNNNNNNNNNSNNNNNNYNTTNTNNAGGNSYTYGYSQAVSQAPASAGVAGSNVYSSYAAGYNNSHNSAAPSSTAENNRTSNNTTTNNNSNRAGSTGGNPYSNAYESNYNANNNNTNTNQTSGMNTVASMYGQQQQQQQQTANPLPPPMTASPYGTQATTNTNTTNTMYSGNYNTTTMQSSSAAVPPPPPAAAAGGKTTAYPATNTNMTQATPDGGSGYSYGGGGNTTNITSYNNNNNNNNNMYSQANTNAYGNNNNNNSRNPSAAPMQQEASYNNYGGFSNTPATSNTYNNNNYNNNNINNTNSYDTFSGQNSGQYGYGNDAAAGEGRGGSSNRTKHYARKPPTNSRVKLQNAPNPSRDIRLDEGGREFLTTNHAQAPLSYVDFIGIDNGDANPKFFRPTAAVVPADATMVKNYGMPFGAVLTPLCRPLYQQEEVPLINSRPPVRCKRCRGYISCHVTWAEMGRSWICPLCEMRNEVESEYFCNLDERGMRLDREEKLELSRGSVEYDVDNFPEYAVTTDKGVRLPSRPLHHLFLIDISISALHSFLPDYVAGIRAAVQGMAERSPQSRISFITFANQLHFYNMRDPRLPQYCVSDVDNPFSPLPFTLCWLEVGSEMDKIDHFLNQVEQYAMDGQEKGCVLGAAVKVSTLVLNSMGGGKVIMCAHTYPQTGLGAFTLREQHKLYGTDKEKELLRPMEGFWTTTAVEAAKQNISFDLFMFCPDYAELVTLSNVCHVTNGRLFLFSKYDAQVDVTKVHANLLQLTTDEAGYAGILRVRCSTGLKVKRYHGHYLSQTSQDMDLASITGCSTFFVDFEHESKLSTNNYIYFQVALLYTTRSGHRRVRVQSCRLRVVDNYVDLFAASDLEATLYCLIQHGVNDAVNKGFNTARHDLTQRLIKMLVSYRRYVPCKDDRGKTLLMPGRLRLLPCLITCLYKSDAFSEGTTVRIDDRIHNIYDLLTMPVYKLIAYLYPTLYAVDNLQDEPTYGTMDPIQQKCNLPPLVQLLLQNVVKEGVYLLSDEQSRLVYLWIGSLVPEEVSSYLFGTPDARLVGRDGGPDESEFNDRLRNILYAVTTKDDGVRRLLVIHDGDPIEETFFKLLKEEAYSSPVGYSEYLSNIHTGVRAAFM